MAIKLLALLAWFSRLFHLTSDPAELSSARERASVGRLAAA
ncbi:MAG: hypothetical protein SAJ37_06775 [Oscillatoria sp. PMC 1068.18]|nr:hypothetical protein [Oscillatoria sp. PMC 1076.18]MEC4988437.1 hypothetical protein [Oscillatoria sp. PMC 1068.18]